MRIIHLTSGEDDVAVLFTQTQDSGDDLARDATDDFSPTAPRWRFDWEAQVADPQDLDQMPREGELYVAGTEL